MYINFTDREEFVLVPILSAAVCTLAYFVGSRLHACPFWRVFFGSRYGPRLLYWGSVRKSVSSPWNRDWDSILRSTHRDVHCTLIYRRFTHACKMILYSFARSSNSTSRVPAVPVRETLIRERCVCLESGDVFWLPVPGNDGSLQPGSCKKMFRLDAALGSATSPIHFLMKSLSSVGVLTIMHTILLCIYIICYICILYIIL